MTEKLKWSVELRDGSKYAYEPKVRMSQVMGIEGRPPCESESLEPYLAKMTLRAPKPKKLYNKGSKYHK